MSTPLQDVTRLLAQIEIPGSFATHGTAAPDDLRLSVTGVGRVRLPVTAAQARLLDGLKQGLARWDAIAAHSSRLGTRSATGAMGDIFERNADPIEGYVGAFRPETHQVGAVFVLNGQPAGLDLFDSATTFRALFPKILRGYALDALALQGESTVTAATTSGTPDIWRERARQLATDALEAPRRDFSLPGLGDTWRLLAPKLSGGGVSLDGRVVHLSAFRTQAA
jgi:hypothetical protein